jgi:hypothetical protein
MGYYTAYELTVDKRGDEINEYTIDEPVDAFTNYALDYAGDNRWYPSDRVKWYDHDADMITLSAHFPDVLFTLDGEGEETGDIWRKWYKNGILLGIWTLEFNVPEYPEGYTS